MKVSIISQNQSPHAPDQPYAGVHYSSNLPKHSCNIVDLLRTAPSPFSLEERICKIGLSKTLEKKILLLQAERNQKNDTSKVCMTARDEKELATEVLLRRHSFTCLVFENRIFRQAALTVIQNIYLFQQRRIFFETSIKTSEQERQEALLLFSQSPDQATVPLGKAFQHLILARVWDRIISVASNSFLDSQPFAELHDIIEQLNTLRNIYMLLSVNLVRKLTLNISAIYRQSVSPEDANQIGSFGVARAAYRYHPSIGLRFSTYASHWIQKEIQRQALESRLIRISANLVEKISRAARTRNYVQQDNEYDKLSQATAQLAITSENPVKGAVVRLEDGPQEHLERKEQLTLLLGAIEKLPVKSKDVIMRRFGLGEYSGNTQSVIEISNAYGVTRGSIYQLEQTAFKHLRGHLAEVIFTDSQP